MKSWRTYATAEARWAGIGPYYAMFPTHFADTVIARYTDPGDLVLDPFSGRGTAVYSATCQAREGIGIEINPVGWVYSEAKCRPGTRSRVERRVREIGDASRNYSVAARRLPEFFNHCYSAKVRRFLVAARELLKWKTSRVDRTVAALLMVYLHGKLGAAFSNQMRQTKAMAPDYAVAWWRERGMKPPALDPVEFLMSRISWRYAKGIPAAEHGRMYLGDSSVILPRIGVKRKGVKLLFTSPPYFARTNYHYDQWLRLWLLGGHPNPRRRNGDHELRAKFESRRRYEELVRTIFKASAELLSNDAVVYIRTGDDEVTYQVTRGALTEAFPGKRIRRVLRPYAGPTQTSLFVKTAGRAHEVDLILRT